LCVNFNSLKPFKRPVQSYEIITSQQNGV